MVNVHIKLQGFLGSVKYQRQIEHMHCSDWPPDSSNLGKFSTDDPWIMHKNT